jgi:hypothetical protein
MTKKKFTEEQVVRILHDVEAGTKSVADICRERGITKNTFCASIALPPRQNKERAVIRVLVNYMTDSTERGTNEAHWHH